MEIKNSRSSEEIDLFYFFNPLLKWLKSFQIFLKNYLRTLQRNAPLFIFIFVLTVLLGYALRFLIPDYYRTNALFISRHLPARFCSIAIDNLRNFPGNEKNTSLLAEQLHVSPQTASMIKSISSEPVDSVMFSNTRDSTAAVFQVNLIVKDTSAIQQVQEGLKNFLESNSYALKQKEARKRTLVFLRNNLIIKRYSLDSLKQLVKINIVPRSTGQQLVFGVPVNPVNIYQVEKEYYREQLAIEEELSMIDGIEVIQPFLKISRPNYPDFRKLFLYFLLIGLVLALVSAPIIGRK